MTTFIDVIFFKRPTQSHVALDGLKRGLLKPVNITVLRRPPVAVAWHVTH